MAFTIPDDFARQCLISHNNYRAQHGSPPLLLNYNISQYAQEWADNISKRDALEHRPKPRYGENIYFCTGRQITGEMPVRLWYSEVKNYDYNKPKFSLNTGHFTQLVWKNSTDVGIGIAFNGKNYYVVADYNPPGNFQGQFKENVPPKL